MLIRRHTLDQIRTGDIDLAFRRWRRPTVKTGGTLTTAIGVLDIHSVDAVDAEAITEEEARRAGFADRAALLEELGKREGTIYRIALSYRGMDPRLALREDDDLSEEDLEALGSRLARLDARSTRGPWTRAVLEAIRDSPGVRAADLAARLGWEKPWFKAQVRKLKSLGLTVSHSPGYSLSPRGSVALDALLGEVTDDDLHPEVDMGPPVGREIL